MLPVLFYPQAGHHNVHSVRIAKQNSKIHKSDFDYLSLKFGYFEKATKFGKIFHLQFDVTE